MTAHDPVAYGEFVARVRRRLERGATEYAARPAAERPLLELLGELAEELEDVAGWSHLLWRRLRAMRERLLCAAEVR